MDLRGEEKIILKKFILFKYSIVIAWNVLFPEPILDAN